MLVRSIPSLLAMFTLAVACVPCFGQMIIPPEKLPGLDAVGEPQPTLAGAPLLFHTTFDDGAERFVPTDPKAWKVVEQQGNKVFALRVRISDYKPKHRSPHNIALIKGLNVTSPRLDVRLQSAMTDYGHRSLCLFFNHQDADHFYYVHFGKVGDPRANQIFIVNGADRTLISETTTKGTPWTDNWHHARVIRDEETGRIAIYFDDMEKPAMTATDTTFRGGSVGIGSFDDAGNFDHVSVYGHTTESR